MQNANEVDAAPCKAHSLSFDRTIERQRVHRTAISEVFLTDIQVTGTSDVLIAAQLPSSHAFFHDHIRGGIDPLLFLEVARQATIASAHALGVPPDSILISSDFELSLNQKTIRELRRDDTNIVIENRFDWTSVRSGVARAGRCDQELSMNGVVIARHWSSGRILTRTQLSALRGEYRGTPPPMSDELSGDVDVARVAAGRIGRAKSENVVIAAINAEAGSFRARIAPCLGNRALFDHPYDHITMQILTEAARQIHVVASETGAGPREMTSIRGRFHSFAELDSDLHITTSGDGRYVIEQDGRAVAVISIDQVVATNPEA